MEHTKLKIGINTKVMRIIMDLENTKSGVGRTHLVASISNELIEKDKLVLRRRLTSLLYMIKETFKDNSKSENELIELFSNIDMVVID